MAMFNGGGKAGDGPARASGLLCPPFPAFTVYEGHAVRLTDERNSVVAAEQVIALVAHSASNFDKGGGREAQAGTRRAYAVGDFLDRHGGGGVCGHAFTLQAVMPLLSKEVGYGVSFTYGE